MACADAPLPWLERLVSLWWVKEYQELVAAVIALVAAVIVGRPVYIQLRETRRQSSAAAIPNVRDVALELEQYLDELESLRPKILTLPALLRDYDAENEHRLFEYWPEKVSDVIDALTNILEALERSVSRDYAVDRAVEQSGLRLTRRLRDELMLLRTTFLHSTIGADFENGESDESEMAKSARLMVSESLSAWIRWRAEYTVAVKHRIAQIWAKVRFLEEDAIGRSGG